MRARSVARCWRASSVSPNCCATSTARAARAGIGALAAGRRPRSSSAAPRDRSAPRARRACLRAGWSASSAWSRVAATSGSMASASTARRAMKRATSGHVAPRGPLEGERRARPSPAARPPARSASAGCDRPASSPCAISSVASGQRWRLVDALQRRRPGRAARPATRRRAPCRLKRVEHRRGDGVPVLGQAAGPPRRGCIRRDRPATAPAIRRPAAGHVQRPHRAQPPVAVGRRS